MDSANGADVMAVWDAVGAKMHGESLTGGAEKKRFLAKAAERERGLKKLQAGNPRLGYEPVNLADSWMCPCSVSSGCRCSMNRRMATLPTWTSIGT